MGIVLHRWKGFLSIARAVPGDATGCSKMHSGKCVVDEGDFLEFSFARSSQCRWRLEFRYSRSDRVPVGSALFALPAKGHCGRQILGVVCRRRLFTRLRRCLVKAVGLVVQLFCDYHEIKSDMQKSGWPCVLGARPETGFNVRVIEHEYLVSVRFRKVQVR
jgi:hypothetical protein